MMSKLLLTEDQEEQNGNLNARGVYSKPRIKARTKQNLWNVKQERPELFATSGGVVAGTGASAQGCEPGPTSTAVNLPPGFELCGRDGWLHHSGKGIFLEIATGQQLWFDVAANSYEELHVGALLDLVCTGGAATSLGSTASTSSRSRGLSPREVHVAEQPSSTGANTARQPAPRHLIVPDLHRTAQVFKADLDHLDRPAALVALFGSVTGSSMAPTDAAAVGLHERLIRRLAAFRGFWSDEALAAAVKSSLADVAASHGGVHPQVALALSVGSHVVSAAAPGTCLCAAAQISAAGSAKPLVTSPERLAEPETSLLASIRCHRLADVSEAMCLALVTGDLQLDNEEMLAAAAPQLAVGRPRAASVAVLRDARQRGAVGQLAVACFRLGPTPNAAVGSNMVTRPPAKRLRTAEEPHGKIRVRQILLRHWRGSGAAPTDPVRRKPVQRTPEEAELQMLEVLEGLAKDGLCGFSNACKAVSECQSALKGGELAGDMGWLAKDKGVDVQQANGRTVRPVIPTPVLKAAFELEVGQLGDLLHSDLGVHLLLRTA